MQISCISPNKWSIVCHPRKSTITRKVFDEMSWNLWVKLSMLWPITFCRKSHDIAMLWRHFRASCDLLQSVLAEKLQFIESARFCLSHIFTMKTTFKEKKVPYFTLSLLDALYVWKISKTPTHVIWEIQLFKVDFLSIKTRKNVWTRAYAYVMTRACWVINQR